MGGDTVLDNEFKLTDVFPPVSVERWREVVEKDLKGASFEKKLVTHTYEGVAIQPLYSAEDRPGASAERPTGTGAVELRQDHTHPDPAIVRRTVAEDLAGGVDSIILKLDPSGERGLLGTNVDALDEALGEVDLAVTAVAVEAGPFASQAATVLRDLWDRRGLSPDTVSGSHLADPLGALALKGRLPASLATHLAELAELAVRCHGETPGVTAAKVSTCPVHNSGASADQELAVALASGLTYLEAMTDAGLSLEAAARQCQFCFSTSSTFFLDIAKLRAARVLWARLLEAAGADAVPLRLHARTSVRMLTRRDPWVNILRATTGAFAALVGGADIVTVTPYDHLLGHSDRLSRRIARNIPIILAEEAHLSRVRDPGAGSWYLESLTDELAERGWAMFQTIQGRGGMGSVLADGWLKAEVDGVQAERRRNVALRKDPITGVSEYPNLAEELPLRAKPDLQALRLRWDAPGALQREAVSPAEATAFPERRSAEPFEALRDAADAHRAAFGDRPRAFLANLGPVASHTGRAGWIRNVLAAGGIEAPANDGYPGPDEAAAALRVSGTTLAVICSSDTIYAEQAAATARALKAAGACTVVIAGRFGEHEAAWREAGIDLALHIGSDVLDILQTLLKNEGVEA